MKKQAFDVTEHYKSDVSSNETPEFMTTAWRAAWTNTDGAARGANRVLGINSEMDALPIPTGQVNHACGHNLIAIAGVAVALGLKKALQVHNLAGTVVLLGTPGNLSFAYVFALSFQRAESYNGQRKKAGMARYA